MPVFDFIIRFNLQTQMCWTCKAKYWWNPARYIYYCAYSMSPLLSYKASRAYNAVPYPWVFWSGIAGLPKRLQRISLTTVVPVRYVHYTLFPAYESLLRCSAARTRSLHWHVTFGRTIGRYYVQTRYNTPIENSISRAGVSFFLFV
jgi:hypothetical protein